MNRLTEATKYLLLCASILITCGLIAMGFLISKQAQSLGHVVSEDLNSLHYDLLNSDIYKYDGLVVTGSDVINFTKRYLGDVIDSNTGDFTVTIITYQTTTFHKNRSLLRDITNFSSTYYVKPTAEYIGTVIMNENRVITEVEFRQR